VTAWHRIVADVAYAVHGRQLAEYGGLDGVRDRSTVELALARPRNLAPYGDPDAAALADGLRLLCALRSIALEHTEFAKATCKLLRSACRCAPACDVSNSRWLRAVPISANSRLPMPTK